MAETFSGETEPVSNKSLFTQLIPSTNKYSILFFIMVNFLWWISLYLYIPIFPLYIKTTGANLEVVGTVLSAYAIPQVLLRIPIGIWSDRLGRRKPLVAAGVIFTSLGALGLGLAKTPWLLFLARMTAGVGAATWVVFPVYFTEYYPTNDSGRAIGIINFVRNMALIAATAGGGLIAEKLGLRSPFFFAALLGILALPALLGTRESPIPKVRVSFWENFRPVVTRPLLITVSCMAILHTFTIFTGIFGFIPVYASELCASNSELGFIAMINLGFTALGSLNATWAWQRLGYRVTIFWSALFIVASFIATPFISTVNVLMVAQIPFGLGAGILSTIFMNLSIQGLPQEQQATAMGVFQAVYAIGMLAGPIISGFLGTIRSISDVFFLAGAVSLLIAALSFLPVFSRNK
jgi:MFS family permease